MRQYRVCVMREVTVSLNIPWFNIASASKSWGSAPGAPGSWSAVRHHHSVVPSMSYIFSWCYQWAQYYLKLWKWSFESGGLCYLLCFSLQLWTLTPGFAMSTVWFMVDDTDPRLNYNGSWSPPLHSVQPAVNFWGTPYNNTLTGTSDNSTVSFQFNGGFLLSLNVIQMVISMYDRVFQFRSIYISWTNRTWCDFERHLARFLLAWWCSNTDHSATICCQCGRKEHK